MDGYLSIVRGKVEADGVSVRLWSGSVKERTKARLEELFGERKESFRELSIFYLSGPHISLTVPSSLW